VKHDGCFRLGLGLGVENSYLRRFRQLDLSILNFSIMLSGRRNGLAIEMWTFYAAT
jgi:hypothetical protein